MTAHHARELVRNAVFTLAREAGAQFTPRPVIPSEPDGPSQLEPGSLAAVTAAVSLSRAAMRAVRDWCRAAREDGATWAQVAAAMDYDSPAAAFFLLASDLGNGPSAGWTCRTCLQAVTDYGPEAGHPADQEHGHADGCARLAETVRAYDAQWEDEGDGSDG